MLKAGSTLTILMNQMSVRLTWILIACPTFYISANAMGSDIGFSESKTRVHLTCSVDILQDVNLLTHSICHKNEPPGIERPSHF
jgi:hypothetical protein